MAQETLILTILGMWAVTFGIKAGPIALLARRRLPPAIADTVRHLPIAVLSALLLPNVLMPTGTLEIEPANYFLWGTALALAVNLTTKNLLATVLSGMGAVALLRLIFGA